jgi:O-antigen/teichoic acid export membrane protein
LLTTRALLISTSQALARAAELLVAILLVRLLSPQEWANIALLLSLYTAALGLASFGLPEGMLFFLGRLAPGERRSFLVQTTLLLAICGAVAGALLSGLAPLLARAPFEVAGLIPVLALAVLLEVPSLAAPQLLIGDERVREAAAYYAGTAGLRLGAVTLPIVLGYGVRGAVVGLVFSGALKLLLHGGLVAWLTPSGPLRLRWAAVREQLAFTAPLGLTVCASALTASVGKWLVALWAPAELGAYAIAGTQVPVIPILAVATGTVLATRMVHAFRHGLIARAAAYWEASTARMVVLVAPITTAIVLGAPELIPLLFGRAYSSAVLPFQICSLILLSRIADHGGTLRSAGDTAALWRGSLLLLGANLLFGIPLTVAFGMLGTAAGAVLSQAAAWVYLLSRIAAATGQRLGSVVPWKLYGLVLALSGAAAAAAALLAGLGPSAPLPRLGVRWASFAILFTAGARALALRRRLPAIPDDHASFRAPAAA